MKAGTLLRPSVAVVLASLTLGVTTGASAGDPGTAYTLFQLTNQDRTSNGLGALGYSAGLSSIATSAYSGNCGGVHGRSEDMIERNYFSHPIPPCNQYVWTVFNLGAFSSAGENIGWNNYPPSQSVGQINTAFMNSPEHRANIMGSYNQMGTGAWAATGPWSGTGTSYNGVIMYTEIFINGPGGGGAPPPPPPAPIHRAPVSAPAAPVVSTQPPAPAAPAEPSPSPSIPTCPVATDIGEADRTSPAPTLAPDGGPAPCPTPNIVGAAPANGPAALSLTGTIDAGSTDLAVSSAAGLSVGDAVTVAGAGPNGGDLVALILAIQGGHLKLDTAAATSVTDARVQGRPAAEIQGADREASHRGVLETVVDQVLRLFLNV